VARGAWRYAGCNQQSSRSQRDRYSEDGPARNFGCRSDGQENISGHGGFDSQITAPPGRPRGAMLRAYDKKTGEQVGALWMQQSGSPMTDMVNGKQYIIVAVSGGTYSGEVLAFKLAE
jgi:hypothetical protein